VQCLQYKTDQQSDVKKVEKLNNLFFGLMAKGVEEQPRMQQSQQAKVWPLTATSARARRSTPGHSSEAAKQGDREHEPKQSSLGISKDGALRG
jgi:hypothetical protein